MRNKTIHSKQKDSRKTKDEFIMVKKYSIQIKPNENPLFSKECIINYKEKTEIIYSLIGIFIS